MEVRWHIFLIILGASFVTFIPRVLPLMVFSRLQLPDWAFQWLKHVPIAVMAALVGQALLMPGGRLTLFPNLDLAAGFFTLLIAIKTRSLLWTVVAGSVSVMLLRMLFN